ncbi:MAG: VWA domain-containing protein [Thermaceae bacterium]|nr:VWA domain-containing protein [Thermaceae bacterium]
MSFESPWALGLLVGIPLLAGLYWLALGGRSSGYALHTGAGLLRVAARPRQAHLLAVLYLLAVGLALFALARPEMKLMAPTNLAGVMLAIENGWAMSQTDLLPSRFEATKAAALALVKGLPPNVPVGITTFAGTGTVLLPPTLDRGAVYQALQNLDYGGGNAFVYGLQAALQAMPAQAEGGSPGVIVLFAHGHTRFALDPLQVAATAAKRGIKIYTVGVGTPGHDFEEDILKAVAQTTGGLYRPIFAASDLGQVYTGLGKTIVLKPKATEVSGMVALAAAVLLILSLGLGTYRRQVV